MKTFRNNRRLQVLVITLVLGAVAAVGGVGLPGTEAPAAVLAAGPDASAAAQPSVDISALLYQQDFYISGLGQL